MDGGWGKKCYPVVGGGGKSLLIHREHSRTDFTALGGPEHCYANAFRALIRIMASAHGGGAVHSNGVSHREKTCASWATVPHGH